MDKYDTKNGEPPIYLKLLYKNKEYELIDNYSFTGWREDDEEYSTFWWTEGNGDCDGNRSNFIREKYSDFPKIECGNEIKLLELKILI